MIRRRRVGRSLEVVSNDDPREMAIIFMGVCALPNTPKPPSSLDWQIQTLAVCFG